MQPYPHKVRILYQKSTKSFQYFYIIGSFLIKYNRNIDISNTEKTHSTKKNDPRASHSEEEGFSDADKESDYFGSYLIPHEQLEKIKSSRSMSFDFTS